MFLFPILNTVTKQNPFELLRLTSLGVIGALVKTDDPEVIHFLLNTELILLCLRIMDIGLDLSKTLAVFILQKILTDDAGLAFVCSVPNRLQLVSEVFCKVLKIAVPKTPLPVDNTDQRKRLFKHIIRCFCRLVDDPKYAFFSFFSKTFHFLTLYHLRYGWLSTNICTERVALDGTKHVFMKHIVTNPQMTF